MKCLPIVIRFITQHHHRTTEVHGWGESLQDPRDDVASGIEEVISVEGSVLDLGPEVVDLGHEGTDN